MLTYIHTYNSKLPNSKTNIHEFSVPFQFRGTELHRLVPIIHHLSSRLSDVRLKRVKTAVQTNGGRRTPHSAQGSGKIITCTVTTDLRPVKQGTVSVLSRDGLINVSR